MNEVITFFIGAVIGGGVAMVYYRRNVAKVEAFLVAAVKARETAEAQADALREKVEKVAKAAGDAIKKS